MFTRVDFPSPDSPEMIVRDCKRDSRLQMVHTNDHNIEVEALADTFAVPLVGQICETNITSELPSDNVLHVIRSLSHDLGVFRSDGLRDRTSRGSTGGRGRRWFSWYRGGTGRCDRCGSVRCCQARSAPKSDTRCSLPIASGACAQSTPMDKVAIFGRGLV